MAMEHAAEYTGRVQGMMRRMGAAPLAEQLSPETAPSLSRDTMWTGGKPAAMAAAFPRGAELPEHVRSAVRDSLRELLIAYTNVIRAGVPAMVKSANRGLEDKLTELNGLCTEIGW